MVDDRVRGDHDALAHAMGAPAEVEVVAEEWQGRVEARQGLPDVATDQHARRADGQDVAGAVMLTLVVVAVWKLTEGRRRPGLLTGVFCAGYGLARIVGELFREPDSFLGFLLGTNWLSMGMVLSLPVLLFGAWMILRAYRKPVLP